VNDLDAFLSEHLARGRIYFTREEALRALTPGSLVAALSQLIRKGRIANPRPGFYLILTPEDREQGAPDPARWIHALMKHQRIDYRVSLLSSAQFHGATQEPAALQLIVPKPLSDFAAGRRKLEFINQTHATFARTNRPEWLAELKTDTGTAKAAGIELTLLDCARWFHKAGGISAVAGITRELGAKALARRLAPLARDFESAAVRRLGYLLELAGHEPQARALDKFAREAKTVKLLDPTSQEAPGEMSGRWKIAVNTPVKGDS
jgi:predicted transcriptional regulator of viral defense system